MTNPAGAAIVNAIRPVRQLVRGGDEIPRRYLVIRRVIVHCRKLLDDQNLPTEDHRRLTRLLGEAEARLQDLASQAAVQN
jgi:hypothetical protein